MKFTKDWFTKQQPDFEYQLKKYIDKPAYFLEIGSFEGRSACWMLENILTNNSSHLTCIDTWDGSDEYGKMDISMKDKYQTFLENIKPWKNKTTVLRGASQELLRGFTTYPKFDFIYIDGSHNSWDVLEDIVLSWRLLNPGGLMALDDYEWTYMDDPRKEPKKAIDAFLDIYQGQYELVVRNWMVWVVKN